jgi:5-methylcytosine-specific restriction protein A
VSAKYDNTDGRLRGRALQARRLRKWTAAKGKCAKCGCLTNYPDGFQLDHIQAIVNGGKDDEDQTQVLCIPCHDTKTNTDLKRRNPVQIGADGWPVGAGGE